MRSFRYVIAVHSVLAVAVLHTVAGAQGAAARPFVTEDEFNRWRQELSNWGRWGKDDQAGALNLITRGKAARSRRPGQGRDDRLAGG